MSAQAAVTKYHSLSGLNNTNFFPHGAGGWKSTTEVSAEYASPEAPLLGLQPAVFALCLHAAFSLRVSLPIPLTRLPLTMDLDNILILLNCHFQDPIFKHSHVL